MRRKPESDVDRSDPAERAARRVRDFERHQRWSRVVGALTLFALAALAPLVTLLAGDPGATVGAVVGAALLTGWGAVVWPWTWSDAERRHHDLTAIWHEARAGADEATPWERYAAWAREDGGHIELLQIRRAGSTEASETAAPSPLSVKVVRRLDADAIADAATAMDALRDDVAELEARARQNHIDAQAAAAQRPYEDALREVDDAASAEQRRAEAEMLRDLAASEAAERRAQAAAVARALRRP